MWSTVSLVESNMHAWFEYEPRCELRMCVHVDAKLLLLLEINHLSDSQVQMSRASKFGNRYGKKTTSF